MDKLLLLYKKSTFELHLARRLSGPAAQKGSRLDAKLAESFVASHRNHYQTLARVRAALDRRGIHYLASDRGREIRFRDFRWIVTVGGDGTVLSAASRADRQILLGVNSNPKVSIGRFCAVTAGAFAPALDSLVSPSPATHRLSRLAIRINGRVNGTPILNDLLFSHANPSAMSHYELRIGARNERQRSSGIWISTAAGSTGAILSAGGRVQPFLSKEIQYQTRELFVWGQRRKYALTGGLLSPQSRLEIVSLMDGGMLYLDGSIQSLALRHGDHMSVIPHPHPLRLMDYQNNLLRTRR
jgi:NAD+ kinase